MVGWGRWNEGREGRWLLATLGRKVGQASASASARRETRTSKAGSSVVGSRKAEKTKGGDVRSLGN